jgi:hypothetical protein
VKSFPGLLGLFANVYFRFALDIQIELHQTREATQIQLVCTMWMLMTVNCVLLQEECAMKRFRMSTQWSSGSANR